ncbi:MAG: HAD family hydrolase [Chloroflexota bacterium]|nr:HAD family hydrolase [Chloroflexota bacterium]
MVRAVTFDFWGTLYQNAYAREERLGLLGAALERHGQPRAVDELDAAYARARAVWDQVWRQEQRSISIERWLDELLDHLNARLPDTARSVLGEAIEEVYLAGDAPRPVPGVRDVLPDLSERYRLGLISDTGLAPGRVLRQVMCRDGLLPYFEVLTFSDELGTAKPQPESFHRTLDVLNVMPGEAAHVGDLPETDLRGARRVGMKAVLFLGVSHREDGRDLADGIFEHYGELRGLLERLR